MGNHMTKLLVFNHEAHEGKDEVESSPSQKHNEAEGEQSPRESESTKNESTPVVVQRKPIADPRSATAGIQRTPIQTNVETPVTSNRSSGQLLKGNRPYLETDLDRVMPPLTPKKSEPRLPEPAMEVRKDYLTPTIRNNIGFPRKLTVTEKERFRILGIDPRSPAADFNRTPILTPVSMLRLRARSQEKLNRLGSYDGDVCRFSYCETLSEFGVPEVQTLPQLAATAIKSLNLVDMECSDVFNESGSSCSDDSAESLVLWSNKESNSSLGAIESFKDFLQKSAHACASPDTGDSGATRKESLGKVKVRLALEDAQVKSTDTEVTEGNKVPNDTENEKIVVWRDSLTTLPQVEQIEAVDATVAKATGETMQPAKAEVIPVDNDIVVRDSLSSKISRAPSESQRKLEIIKRNKNTKGERLTAEDKKMFSDKSCPDTAKMRTPLGNRSNNGPVFLAAGMSPQQILRKKGITPKMLQENTPPHRRSVPKSKLAGIQWDPDSTVLI